MPTVNIYNVGGVGINKDLPSHYLPPEAWSDGKNMRFQDRVATKMKGYQDTFGTPTVVPGFLMNLPTAASSFWIYCSLTKAYVYEAGVHTNITRQSGGVDVNYTPATYRAWNGGVLGGIPILNNGADIPQYWSAISAATKLANLTNWPSTLRARVVRPFGPFLVALNINDNSVLYPHMVWWSHPADPGSVPSSWDYADAAYDAGRKELTDSNSGAILDGLMLRNYFIIYKENSTHYMRFVGGQEIMANDILFPESGILATRCVALVNKGSQHFVVTQDDVIAHKGQADTIESLLDQRVRKYLFNDIDTTNYVNSFCFDNPGQREAIFAYPEVGATYPTKALVWNYQYNTIQFRSFEGVCSSAGPASATTAVVWDSLTPTWDTASEPWSEEGRRAVILGSVNNTKLYKLDDGETFDGTDMNSYLERLGLAVVGKDRQGQPKADFRTRKLVTRIWPKITGTEVVTVRVGAQEDIDGTVTWGASQFFTPGTTKFLDVTANGRFIAVRFEATGNKPWQLEGYDLDLTVLGEH